MDGSRDAGLTSVRLRRSLEDADTQFGIIVETHAKSPGLTLSDLVEGGTADRCGGLKRGDVIKYINGIDVASMTNEVALLVMQHVTSQELLLQVQKSQKRLVREQPVLNRPTLDEMSDDVSDRNLLEARGDESDTSGRTLSDESVLNGRDSAESVDAGGVSEGSEQLEGSLLPGTESQGSILAGTESVGSVLAGRKQEESVLPGRKLHGGVLTGRETESVGHDKNSPLTSTPNNSPKAGQTESKASTLRNLLNEAESMEDTLHLKAEAPHMGCTSGICSGSVMNPPEQRPPGTRRSKKEIIRQSRNLLEQYYSSLKMLNSPDHEARWRQVLGSIEATGTYDMTLDELTFGAKTAWRNAPRCIGRIQWSKLKVFDGRHVKTARQMFDVLCEHILYATNNGMLRSAITIFPPRTDGRTDFKIWSAQLIRYAGYRNTDGTITGDPATVEITQLCIEMGWTPPITRGPFDVLPLVLQANGGDPELFTIPDELVLQVPLSHPKYPRFAELGLRWYALPVVANMCLDCGGLEYTGAPFSGWYMSSEIATRDLCDEARYNVNKPVADVLGLDTKTNLTLWKDEAMTRTNVAVLHSFQKHGVTITDHHSASESFMMHMKNEVRVRGGCPADWVWIVPPISGSLTPVFHQEMLNYKLRPSYEYQDPAPWKTHKWRRPLETVTEAKKNPKLKFKQLVNAVRISTVLMRKAMLQRIKCTILYATETGRAHTFSIKLADLFTHSFDTKLVCMEDYDVTDLQHESLVLVVTSTFGNGDPPENGVELAKSLHQMSPLDKSPLTYKSLFASKSHAADLMARVKPTEQKRQLSHLRFSVFGLGSSAYPQFCAFAVYMDAMLEVLGGERVQGLATGDEQHGQEEDFKQWSQQIYKETCSDFSLEEAADQKTAEDLLSHGRTCWAPHRFRLVRARTDVSDLQYNLSKGHNKQIFMCKLKSREQLQDPQSERQTILCRLTLPEANRGCYEVGDHVGIYPANRKFLVDAVLAKTQFEDGISADTPVTTEHAVEGEDESAGSVTERKWTQEERLPVTTLRDALTHLLDVTSSPTQNFIKQLSQMALSADDRDKLEQLASDAEVYEEWRYDGVPGLGDVITQFPSLVLPAAFLLRQLPLLQQRLYSISSSPDLHPDEVHATVAVLTFRTQGGLGPVKEGVCSSWLNTIDVDTDVPCFIRKAPHFHLPQDQCRPIILVGPGTGVAPLRAFWQQRMVDLQSWGPHAKSGGTGFGRMSLYFGCRREALDNIYKEEKKAMEESGVLSDVFLALSREPGVKKAYVQDVLIAQSGRVYRELVEEHGHLFVCGDVTMASNICQTLENILVTEGAMTPGEARNYVMTMREKDRFHEDIFGVTLKTSHIKQSVREQVRLGWKRIADASRVRIPQRRHSLLV